MSKKAIRRAYLVQRLNLEAEQRGLVGNLTAEEWRSTILHFDGNCAYCGCGHARLTVDHYIPQSLGGHTIVSNVVPACYECNGRKSDRLPPCCKWFFPQKNLRKISTYLRSVQQGESVAAYKQGKMSLDYTMPKIYQSEIDEFVDYHCAKELEAEGTLSLMGAEALQACEQGIDDPEGASHVVEDLAPAEPMSLTRLLVRMLTSTPVVTIALLYEFLYGLAWLLRLIFRF